jgi:hypothetical protein
VATFSARNELLGVPVVLVVVGGGASALPET